MSRDPSREVSREVRVPLMEPRAGSECGVVCGPSAPCPWPSVVKVQRLNLCLCLQPVPLVALTAVSLSSSPWTFPEDAWTPVVPTHSPAPLHPSVGGNDPGAVPGMSFAPSSFHAQPHSGPPGYLPGNFHLHPLIETSRSPRGTGRGVSATEI